MFLHVDDERRRRRDQVFIPPGKCFYYELGRVVRRNDDGRRDSQFGDGDWLKLRGNLTGWR